MLSTPVDLAAPAASPALNGADLTHKKRVVSAAPFDLNPEQQAVVAHEPAAGALLVAAGAGAGKTATLVARVVTQVLQGADPQRLLLLTFSRRAAAEMQRRIGSALHQALGLSRASAAPVLPWCGTFHAVAVRLLQQEAPHIGLAPGFTVLDASDAQDLIGVLRQDLGLDATQGAHRFPMPATCASIHSRCINAGLSLEEALQRHYPWVQHAQPGLLRLFAAYGEAKRAQRLFDFDDLLIAWHQLLEHPTLAPRLRARFDQVLVDEAQDINRLQADIVHRLSPAGRGLLLVGDDAQAIYAFRGAEARHLLDFPQRYTPPARVLALTQNYRSTQPLLEASNAVIALAPRRFAKNLWTSRSGGLPPQLVATDDELTQARGVADAVLACRESGTVLRQQAVLFRTSHHSAALELELARRHIPFVKFGGLRFLESAHVKDVLAVLRWALNPQAALCAWRVARLVPGVGAATARRLLHDPAAPEQVTPPARARDEWQRLLTLLQTLRAPEAPWPGSLHQVLTWYRPQLERTQADAAQRWLDLEHLATLAAAAGSAERFVTEMALDPPAASSDEAGDPHLDEDYLILSTIHSAKGQEWQAVHVLNVVDGCMPADMAAGEEELEEERRLLYVAMTRARQALSLWVPQRFYVTQQRQRGDRHLYAIRSRFLAPELLGHFEQTVCSEAALRTDPAAAEAVAPGLAMASVAMATVATAGAPAFDLMAAVHGASREPFGGGLATADAGAEGAGR